MSILLLARWIGVEIEVIRVDNNLQSELPGRDLTDWLDKSLALERNEDLQTRVRV